MPLDHGCPWPRPSSPEVTRAFCLVPSTPFSQTPWYTLPVHLCRFRVRSVRWSCFLEPLRRPRAPLRDLSRRRHTGSVTTSRCGNINPLPIDYASRPRLRDRLTLRGLTLRRNPWTSGGSVSHASYRYSCQHSRFRYLQDPSRVSLRRLTERSATARLSTSPKLRCVASAPLHFRRRPAYLDQ